MGAFILLFLGVLLYYVRYKRDWYFVTGIVVLVCVLMLLYTYSRSAMLALGFAAFIALIFLIKTLYLRYKTQVLVIGGILLIV